MELPLPFYGKDFEKFQELIFLSNKFVAVSIFTRI